MHDCAIVWGIFDLVEHDAHGSNQGLYQRDGDRLRLCGFDIQEGIPGIFEVRSMLAEVAGPGSCLGPRGCNDAYVALADTHKLKAFQLTDNRPARSSW